MHFIIDLGKSNAHLDTFTWFFFNNRQKVVTSERCNIYLSITVETRFSSSQSDTSIKLVHTFLKWIKRIFIFFHALYTSFSRESICNRFIRLCRIFLHYGISVGYSIIYMYYVMINTGKLSIWSLFRNQPNWKNYTTILIFVLINYQFDTLISIDHFSISRTPKKSDSGLSALPFSTPIETWSFKDNSKTVTAEVSSKPEWRPSDLVSNFCTPFTLKVVITISLRASIL